MLISRPNLAAAALTLSLCMPVIGAEDGPERAMQAFTAALNAQDAAGAAAMFHEDGKLLPPGQPIIEGMENIQAFWQGSFEAGVAGIEKTAIEVVVSGELAVQTSSFVLTIGEDSVPGKETLVWRPADDGTWKISTDIWATDQ